MYVAVVGDIYEGICDHGEECCPHDISGYIIDGSPNFNIDGSAVAIDGSNTVHTGCPHCTEGIVTASDSNTIVNSKAIARDGDTIVFEGGSAPIQAQIHRMNVGG